MEDLENMENKIKQVRIELISVLKNKEITFYEWERIRNFIDEKYEVIKRESTL